MSAETATFFLGHVKVVQHSRFPKRWTWEVHSDSTGSVVERADTVFPHPEEAWKEGRRVLDRLEAAKPSRRARGRQAA